MMLFVHTPELVQTSVQTGVFTDSLLSYMLRCRSELELIRCWTFQSLLPLY